jgi:hypothetical protein
VGWAESVYKATAIANDNSDESALVIVKALSGNNSFCEEYLRKGLSRELASYVGQTSRRIVIVALPAAIDSQIMAEINRVGMGNIDPRFFAGYQIAPPRLVVQVSLAESLLRDGAWVVPKVSVDTEVRDVTTARLLYPAKFSGSSPPPADGNLEFSRKPNASNDILIDVTNRGPYTFCLDERSTQMLHIGVSWRPGTGELRASKTHTLPLINGDRCVERNHSVTLTFANPSSWPAFDMRVPYLLCMNINSSSPSGYILEQNKTYRDKHFDRMSSGSTATLGERMYCADSVMYEIP